jgi:hypothetical protein
MNTKPFCFLLTSILNFDLIGFFYIAYRTNKKTCTLVFFIQLYRFEKKKFFQMSENEDFESLKVIELQNELKKRGLDTRGRKADLIERLRQAVNNGIEGDNHLTNKSLHNISFIVTGTSTNNSVSSNDELATAVIKDDTSSLSSVS